MIKSLFFKRGLWRTYLFSFIAVFLACSIIVISSFYVLVDKLLKDEVAQFSLNMANQVKDVMDMRIEEMYNMAFQISLEKRVQGFLYVKKPFDAGALLTIPEIITLLSGYRSANSFVSDVGIYYSNSDSVITSSGCFDIDDFFDSFADYKGISREGFLDILKDPHYKDIIPLNTITGDYKLNGEYITYMQSLPIGDKVPSATIMFFVNKNALLTMMANHMPEEIGQVQIFTTDGKLIASKDNQELLDDSLRNSMEGQQKTFFIEDKNKAKNIASYAASQSINWYYVVILSLQFTVKKVQYIRNLTALIALISCIVGIIMSLFMTRFNYRPWQSLLKYLEIQSSKKANEAGENEYLYVKDAIKVILNEREKIQYAFEKNKKYAKHYILQRLCEGESISKEDLLNNKIDFPYDYFNVAAIKAKEEIKELKSIYKSIILKLENMQEEYRIFSFYDQNEILYIILNMDKNLVDEQNLYDMVESLGTRVGEIIVEPIALGVGSTYCGLESLSASYREAKKSLECSILNEDSCIVYYRDLPEFTAKLMDLSLDFNRRLYNCLKKGDHEGTSAMLDLCFSQLMKQTSVPVSDVHYIYYNLINTAIQLCNDLQINLEVGCGQKKEKLLNVCDYRSIKHLIKNLYTVYSNLCEYIIKENERDKNYLREQIERYVYEHFRDESLCSAEVADYLNISISYLSRYMSKTFGMGFGDYLNKVRMDHAKKLLECSSKTINEIASEVGYTSPSSFIRTFKRIEGITPGQFKEST